MTRDLLQEVNTDLNELFATNFAAVYHAPAQKAMVCQALVDYIPIEAFKDTFTRCGNLMGEFITERFIFDKRKLRAFHQPSMVWYFTDWKLGVNQKYGLSRHFKLLPQEDWFVKCVEAGRNQIFAEFGQEKFNLLTITYCNTLQEALEYPS